MAQKSPATFAGAGQWTLKCGRLLHLGAAGGKFHAIFAIYLAAPFHGILRPELYGLLIIDHKALAIFVVRVWALCTVVDLGGKVHIN